MKALIRNLLVIGMLAGATTAMAQPTACPLDPYRARIDRIAALMTATRGAETTVRDSKGRAFRALDIGLTGEVEGCVALAGPIPQMKAGYSWFYDAAEIALAQEHMLPHDPGQPYKLPLSPGDGNTTPPHFAKGRFEAADGAGLNLFLPARPSDWNGKLFIAQRGSGVYDPMAPLAPGAAADPFPALSGASVFVQNMIDRGYAVAYFRKDAVRPPLGVSKARLADGREVSTSYVASVALALAMTEFAQKQVAEAMGRKAEKTYYYGHSGGGITGRLINYSGANSGADGRPIIDALILDDAGNGLYLPVAFRNGVDVLLSTKAERDRFRPQIDIAHQSYNPASFLEAKRLNARLLAEKGLSAKHRNYEIRGVSHFDAGMSAMAQVKQDPSNLLELSGLMTALIDDLDAWATRGVAPPPSRGPVQGDAGVAMPEFACPLGTYRVLPAAGATMTHLEAFDGSDETVTAAWRRLGLVEAGQTVDRARYLACIDAQAKALIADRFLPAGAGPWYQQYAARMLERTGAKLS